MIGFIGLFDCIMHHGDALVAIALGEREYWGKGYGTDAMQDDAEICIQRGEPEEGGSDRLRIQPTSDPII